MRALNASWEVVVLKSGCKSLLKLIASSACIVLLSTASSAKASAPASTSAWRDGQFQVDVAQVVGRSDIVLGQPNNSPEEALPLGNGHLGVAVWAASGLTAQLNRSDTLPLRLSPGQIVVPGLEALTHAKDYSGRLDLFDGELHESGGGMAVLAYVEPHSDILVIEVKGAKPEQPQTAYLKLWAPRHPEAKASNGIGILSEHWQDNKTDYASGRSFGSFAAIAAEGRDVVAKITDSRTVAISFKPFIDGHFVLRVASPHFDGAQNAATLAQETLASNSSSSHREWWNAFWRRAALIKITSRDGAGEYMENLRDIDLFITAAGSGDEFPGYHAGIGDMLQATQDEQHWDPGVYWHWDMRPQIAADIGAGLTELNASYFNLYRQNLPRILAWTKQHMRGRSGACIPEAMRFNGNGYEGEDPTSKPQASCDEQSEPNDNARTLSTGAEVSLWIWQQYLATGDKQFLTANYPVMASAARFLLAYLKPGKDGFLHTQPSNAHETQFDVLDPTTDLAAARALFPVVIQATRELDRDATLANQLEHALEKIPPFPRTDLSNPAMLLSPSADVHGQDVLAFSYRPQAKIRNIENISLEPVWPFNLIGDSSPMFELARRTFAHRPNVCEADWSFDPIQAARLDLGGEVGKTLVTITKKYQTRVNGLAQWSPASSHQFFVEQVAGVADALQEALVRDYDGLIRITPAIPPGWDVDGSVFVLGGTKVDVQARSGIPTTVGIESGSTRQLRIRNPWPHDSIEVRSATTGKLVKTEIVNRVVEFQAKAGQHYLLERAAYPTANLPFSPVSGQVADSAKRLGNVQIGLFGKKT